LTTFIHIETNSLDPKIKLTHNSEALVNHSLFRVPNPQNKKVVDLHHPPRNGKYNSWHA